MKSRLLSHKPFWLISVLVMLMLFVTACQPATVPSPTLGANTAPEASSTSTVAPAPAATATTAPTEAMATATSAATETAMVAETGASVEGEATLAVATDPVLGDILVDDKGMTLYMFTKDEPNKSNCAGGCLEAWPPLLSKGSPVAGEGVDEALIGTAEMADGSMIVTYNKMPLYYWQADTAAGQTTGQGVNNVWYVVSPEGDPVGMP